MRTNKLFIGALALVAFGIASCSPASIASGTYNGTYSTYSSSGNGSAVVTLVNDNTVNVKISADGTDHIYDGVTVTKLEIPGITQVSFSGSNSEAYFDGNVIQVSGVKTCSLDIDSVSSSGYIHFTSVN